MIEVRFCLEENESEIPLSIVQKLREDLRRSPPATPKSSGTGSAENKALRDALAVRFSYSDSIDAILKNSFLREYRQNVLNFDRAK